MIIELIGYFGSLLVVVSMLMTSVIKLRIINTVGSLIFTVYALIIKSYPTALMNFSLVVINVYNLYRLLKVQKDYSVVPLSADEAFYQYFLSRFEKNIRKFFPNFDKNATYSKMYMICSASSRRRWRRGSSRSAARTTPRNPVARRSRI